MFKLKAPNFEPAYILIRPAPDGGWHGSVRRAPDGPDVDSTVRSYAKRPDAWQAAFELYRCHFVF
jgi:hypothetical protein